MDRNVTRRDFVKGAAATAAGVALGAQAVQGALLRPEEKLPILTGLNEKAFAADPRVRKVNLYLRDEAGAILVARSDGRIVEDRQPMTLLYLSVLGSIVAFVTYLTLLQRVGAGRG